MTPPTPDSTACPVCGNEYDQRIIVERGDQWSDIYAGTPFSFFQKYRRRCTAGIDVETDTELPDGQRAVYFHGKSGRTTVF